MPFFANGNAGPGAGTVGSPGGYPFLMGVGAIQASTLHHRRLLQPRTFLLRWRPQARRGRSRRQRALQLTRQHLWLDIGHLDGDAAHLRRGGPLLSANPTLTYSDVMGILTRTAYFSPTWGTRPNNNYGWGLVQADAGGKYGDARCPT